MPSSETQTRQFKTINPATGEAIGLYECASSEELLRCIAQAHSTFPLWEATPLHVRAKFLKQLATTLYNRANEAAGIISRETGKPLADALEGDVATALSLMRYYADIGPQRLRSRRIRPDLISVITGRSHRETYHPRGVIGVISPWNYPFAIPASGIVTSLMAGNTVILKPSELTPETGLWLVRLFQEALKECNLPQDSVQVILGDGQTGADLIASSIDGVVFTGSEQTGRRIREAIARRGLWSSLELGGSDAMIVLPGCDLEKVASYALWGRYTNAGQACAAVKRLLVSENQYEAFLEQLQKKISRLRIGSPDEPGCHVGPLISKAQRDLLQSQVDDAVKQGARLITGGRSLERPGWFYEPTLLADVPASARILQEEVFGPVLPVVPYHTLEEAVSIVNSSRFGLTASVFGPVQEAHKLASQLECGSVIINDTGASNYAMVCAPWGGWKESGSGVSHGERALLELSRMKVESVNQLFGLPGMDKPLWHFGKDNKYAAERSQTVLAFSGQQPSCLNPLTWLTFWRHRASTKL